MGCALAVPDSSLAGLIGGFVVNSLDVLVFSLRPTFATPTIQEKIDLEMGASMVENHHYLRPVINWVLIGWR